jgi:phytoene dehydrogenase-like protein
MGGSGGTAYGRPMTTSEQPDAVIIGAGHNGLVAACYLAKAGLDVLVVEANDWIGGCTSTSAIIPEAPQHMINPCAVDICLIRASTIIRDLQLQRYGYREVEVDPAYVAPLPDGSSLAFWRDHQRTADELRRFSAKDARAYLEFMEMQEAGLDAGLPLMLEDSTRPDRRVLARAVGSAAKHPRHVANLLSMITGTAADAIDARFEHPTVRGGIVSLAAVGAPVTARGSGINAMFPSIVSRVGVSRLIGGTGMLPRALVACLQAHGGRVRTSARVDGLLTSGGKARGVRLDSGEEIDARVVISAGDPAKTLRDFVPRGELSDRVLKRVEKIPSDAAGTAYLSVHMALSGRLDLSRLQEQRDDDVRLQNVALLTGSFEDMIASVEAAQAGRLSDRMPVACIVPTGPDPSQAPEGQDTLYLWAGWAPRTPPGGYDEAMTKKAGDAIVSRAAAYYGGVAELEIGRFVEPWTVLRDRTGVPDGNPYYVDLLLGRSGPLRPALGLGGYSTPIPGLYLTGGGTHPGPSVSGIPGQLAARRVLATMRDLPGRARREGTAAAEADDVLAGV